MTSEQQLSGLKPLSEFELAALEEAVASYQGAMTADAARWLKARGIEKTEAVGRRVGVVADPAPGHSHFRGMLSIPYLGPNSEPWSVRFRCIQEHDHRSFGHGKYMSIPGEPPRLYGVSAIFEAGNTIHIAEGEFDSIILNKVGLHAVGVPGANLFQAHHARMLAGFSQIYVWADPDDAGAELMRKISHMTGRAIGVKMPHGLDVTDAHLKLGADGLLALMPKRR